MRRAVVVGLLSVVPAAAAFAAPESYTIDPNHTFPHFAISHLGFSTMHGRFDKTQGKLVIDQEKKTGSVEVVIDATSVDTGFGKRDDHLRSPDFLNVAEFPEIKYKSTKVTLLDGDKANVEGELTLMGVTKPVTLDVHRVHCGVHPMNKKDVCGFDATATIKRSDFGVNYALPAIGDEMKLTFEVEAVKE